MQDTTFFLGGGVGSYPFEELGGDGTVTAYSKPYQQDKRVKNSQVNHGVLLSKVIGLMNH